MSKWGAATYDGFKQQPKAAAKASHKLQNALIIHLGSSRIGRSIDRSFSLVRLAAANMGNVVSRGRGGERGGSGGHVKRVIQITVMIIATIKNCRRRSHWHSRRWSLRVRHSICGKSLTTTTTTMATATVAALAMSLFAVVVDVAAVKVAINIIFFANLQLRTCNLQFLPPQVAQLQVARLQVGQPSCAPAVIN